MKHNFSRRNRAHQGRGLRAVVAGFAALLATAALIEVPANAVAGATPVKAVAAKSVPSANPPGVMWHPLAARPAAMAGHALQIDAPHGRLFTLNDSMMRSALTKSPTEFTSRAKTAPAVVAIPDPINTLQRFKIEYAPVMSAGLARKHPEIRTYSGVGIDDPHATVRISMTPLGFNASVRSEHGSWFVDTLYHLSQSVYVTYYARDLVNTHGNFIEREVSALDSAKIKSPGKATGTTASPSLSAGTTLRVYRLALVSDPSFAAYWTPTTVTAAKVILMTRADQIYEEEFGYRMDLVTNNDLLNLNTPAQAYEPNGACGVSACFTQAQLASCGSSTLTRNRLVVGQLIGAANYDIGHISVGQDGGGIAALGVIGGNNKAQGCTGIPQPDGDYYVTDYLTHEMGHEFSMNHPFNGTQYNCSSSNRNANTSYEPGSGSSIMAYAGICRQDDLQPHSDPYFSAISFQETQAYTSATLANLPEVQTGVLTHFGGGNEVQTVTFSPGYQSVFTVDHGPLTLNISNPTAASGVFPGAAEVGNTVTINTTTAHLLHVGDTVVISGVPVSGYNGTWTITAIPFSTSFQFTDPTSGLAQSGGGTVTPPSFGATESGNTATITTTAPHGLVVGSQVTVAGMTATGYNGAVVVTAVPSPTTFQYTAVTSGLVNSGNGTVTYNAPFQLGLAGNESAVIGGTGLAYNATNVAAAINGIPTFAGTVTVGTTAATGFTITYGGAAANTDVPNLTIDNLSCGGCYAALDETNHGGAGDAYVLKYNSTPAAIVTNTSTAANIQAALQGVNEVQTVSLSNYNTTGASYTLTYNGNTSAPIVRGTNNNATGIAAAIAGIPGWIAGSTVSVASVTDNGYTVTFNGLGDVNPLSVTNGSGTVSGTVAETVKGTSGFFPAGATAAVAAAGFGGSVTGGIQVTFGGTFGANFGAATVGHLSFADLTGSGTGFFSETEKGGPDPYNAGFQQLATGNSPPSAVAPPGPFTIPYQTPFALTGGSTDSDGQVPTYIWEQYDKGGAGTNGGTALVNPTKTSGPLFREFGTALNSGVYNVHAYGDCTTSGNNNGENCAGTNPTRVFPDMAQILANDTNAATGVCPDAIPSAPVPLSQSLKDCLSEWLPTPVYTGPMHFVLTTRDGNPGAGGVTESSLVTVNLAGTSPFRVTSQSTPVSYAGGSTQAVTWDVAGTDTAPISTATMNVLLSTDGGNTFPTVLASGVPNTGSANVVLPDVATSTARIEVAPADGNIYFDVSRSNFTIQASQTITFPPVDDQTYGDPDFSVSASSSSGLPVTFTVGVSDPCSISGASVHITGGGSCTITAHQSGDATHQAAPDVSQVVTIAQAAQTITFNPLDDHTYGDADFDVSAVASSGLPITFTFAGSTGCTVSGSTVHITSTGSCSVKAHQAGDSNYLPAAGVVQTFTIMKDDQTINFSIADHTLGDPDFTVSATATSGLTVAFAVLSGHCTISGSTVHITGAGNCMIEATQPGDSNYNPADAVDRTFTVNQGSQTITFAALPDATFGDSDFTVSASASSGLTVSFAATGECSVTGVTVHLTGAGSCTVTASQPGDGDYNAASDVSRTFSIGQESQSISFAALPGKTYTDADFTVSATATSGLTVEFGATGDCSVTGTTVHLTGAGSCTVAATQPGDTDYAAAVEVDRNFSIAKATQTITFPALGKVKYGSPDIDPHATATSGLPVSYLVAKGPCTVVSNQIHVTAVGTCKITTYQHGDANWRPALNVSRSMDVLPANSKSVLTSNSPVPFGTTIHLVATVTSPAGTPDSGQVQFYTPQGVLAGSAQLVGGTASVDLPAPGAPTVLKCYAIYVPDTVSNWKGSTSDTIKVHIV